MQFLRGWREIAGEFSVKQVTVRRWAEAGAPLYVLEDGGGPVAETAELWGWLKAHSPAVGGGRVPAQHEGLPALLTWGSAAQIKAAIAAEEAARLRG